MQINVNGHMVDVPDGATDEQIKAIVKKNAMSFSVPPKQEEDTGFLGGVGNATYGLAKALADPVYGATQLAINGVNGLYQKASGPDTSSLITGKNSNALQRLTSQYNNFLADNEARYQDDTKGSVAAGAGRFTGAVAPAVLAAFATGGASVPATASAASSSVLNALKNYPTIEKILKGATIGGATALPQPVYNPNADFLDSKLAQVALGGLTGGSLPLAGKVWNATKRAFTPVISPEKAVADSIAGSVAKDSALGNASTPGAVSVPANNSGGLLKVEQASTDPQVTSLLGVRSPQEAMSRISQAQEFIPGSKPRTASVVATPQMVMADKALSNNPAYKEAILQRENENNAARLAAIDRVAKTPEDLAAAEANRATATKPLYEDAFKQQYLVDDKLAEILGRPDVQAALARGEKLARNKNSNAAETFGIQPIDPENPDLGSQINGQTLQYLKMGLQGVKASSNTTGISSQEANALKSTMSDLHDWLLTNAPKYKEADNLYSTLSAPINDMRVGQAIKSTLLNPDSKASLNSAGDSNLTFTNVNNAIKTAMQDEGHYGVTDSTNAVLNALRNDLKRDSIANSVKSAGSDSVYNLQAPNWLAGKVFGQDMSGKGWGLTALTTPLAMAGDLMGGGGLLGAGAIGSLVGQGSKKANAFIGNRVNSVFQDAMMNPEEYARLLKLGLERQASQDGGLLSPQGSSIGGAVASGLLN